MQRLGGLFGGGKQAKRVGKMSPELSPNISQVEKLLLGLLNKVDHVQITQLFV